MSAFRVQCETCQSWLKVRDKGFVGEVHACPKCGSMVLIAAPSGVAASPPAAATPVMAVMGDTLEAVGPPPFGPPPSAVPASASIEAAPLPPEVVAESPTGAAFPWTIAGSVGVTAAAGVATVALLWPSAPEPEAPSQPHAVPAEESHQSPPNDPPPVVTEHSPGDPVASLPEEPAEAVAIADEEPVESRDPEAAPLPPETVATDLVEREDEPVHRIAAANAAPQEEAPTPEEPPAEIDPLAIDFDEVEIVLRKSAAGPGASDSEGDGAADEGPHETPAKTPEPSLDDRLEEAAQHAGVFVRRGATNEASGPFAGSSLAALAYVAPSVDLHDIPLDEALQLVGNVAGVPITIDPVALRLAGVSASKPIEVVGEAVTLSDLLASSLKPLRLGLATEGPYATVVRLEADKARTINHPISDLIANDEAGLTHLLKVVGKLPDNSQILDGKLAVTASLATQYDLVVLCERLRLARKLPMKTKYPPALLSAEPSLATLAPVLDRRTTFSFVEPTPLVDVFAHWRRVTGVSILVDWRALAEIGYGPRSTVECSVTNRPMRAALDGVLGGLGLTWGAIDGHTIWLTTHDAPQQPETIEFYPPGTTAPAGVTAEVDPVSDRVLVRASAVAQRRIVEDSAVPATAGLE